MIINHNMNAMNAHRMMSSNTVSSGKSMEKLSSGLRINRAGDDAAGLAISEKMRGQIRGLDQSTRNSQDGISLIQTAEGALNETHSILQRMRELAVQAANDTNNTDDRGQIQKEMTQLTSEINRIGNTTEFNTMKLLNGEKSTGHIIGSTTTSSTFINSGVEDVYTALGISDGASSLDLASTITIAGSSGDGFDWADISGAATSSTISIGKNASGQLQVDIHAMGGTIDVFSATDKIDVTWDANDEFTYDSHGISFKINKEDFEAASTSTTKDIDLYIALGSGTSAANASISTDNSWESNSGGMKISDGITIASVGMPSGLAAKAASIEVKAIADGTSSIGSLQVSILDADSNVLMTDFVSSLGAATASYDNMGITFTVSAMNASDTSAVMSFSLDDYKTTSSVTTNQTRDDSLTFQVGANENQSMAVGIDDMRAQALGITSTTAGSGFASSMSVTDGTNNTATEYSLNVTTAADAAKSVTTIQAAIDSVSDQRSKLGAYQNRLEHTIANLGTSSENLQSAESRIRDVDMAKEMMSFSKNNILSQAAQAMLAQANQQPQGVLQLLG